MFHLIDDCEHPLLYLSGTGITSYDTAIPVSLHQNLAGICNSVWVWWLIMGWIPRWGSLWMVHPAFICDLIISLVIFNIPCLFCTFNVLVIMCHLSFSFRTVYLTFCVPLVP
jgi:H+/Cl- antiporter ClcA